MIRGRVFLATLIMGCAPGDRAAPFPGPPEGYSHAYAHGSCAPWDGAAVEFLLTATTVDSGARLSPEPPYVRITIWRGLDRLAGSAFAWPTSEQIGAVMLCRSASECEHATTAAVRFGPADSTGVPDGLVEARFPGGTTVRGGFHPIWWNDRVFCG